MAARRYAAEDAKQVRAEIKFASGITYSENGNVVSLPSPQSIHVGPTCKDLR
jgi:hypothetical protein